MQDVIAKLKSNLTHVTLQEKIDIASLVTQRIISKPIIIDAKTKNTGNFKNAKITIYPGNQKLRQQLIAALEKIIELELVSAIPIKEVLQQKTFIIVFAKHNEMLKFFGLESNNLAHIGGMFSDNNMMFLPLDTPLDISTLSHEFLHAYAYNPKIR